jgi:hypothetical protein
MNVRADLSGFFVGEKSAIACCIVAGSLGFSSGSVAPSRAL